MFASRLFQPRAKSLLHRNLEVAENRMNQAIVIRDLMLTFEDKSSSKGEFNNCIPNAVNRLITHINLLMNITNDYHQQLYYTKNQQDGYDLNQGAENKITRLLLSEFSLYTYQPLTVNEFQEVIAAIEKTAAQQHSNVHLLLSSLALEIDRKEEIDRKTNNNKIKKTILNVCIYIQCGIKPIVHVFAKGRESDKDLSKPTEGWVNFEQQDLFSESKGRKISALIGRESEAALVSNLSVFPIVLPSGAAFIQAIDICYDHLVQHSKTLLTNQLETDDIKNAVIMPRQIDHIVTSNWIDIEENACLTPKTNMVHIDAYLAHKDYLASGVNNSPSIKLNLHRYTNENYYVTYGKEGVNFNFPEFGERFYIHMKPERQLSAPIAAIANSIDERNTQVKNYLADTRVGVDIEKIYRNNLDLLFNLLQSDLFDWFEIFLSSPESINIIKPASLDKFDEAKADIKSQPIHQSIPLLIKLKTDILYLNELSLAIRESFTQKIDEFVISNIDNAFFQASVNEFASIKLN